MNYSWDLRNLENDKKLLEKIIKKENNPSLKYKKLVYLDFLNMQIKCKKAKVENNNSSHAFLSIYQNYYFYQRYFELINRYYSISIKNINKHNFTIDDFEQKIKKYLDNNVNSYYSLDECFEIANDFYKNTTNDYYSKFLKIYKNKDFIVREDENLFDTEDKVGYCFHVNELNKPYISIQNMEGLSKVNTIIHEIAHSIMNFKYPDRFFYTHDYFNNEIESTFFEMIFYKDYLKNSNSLDVELINAENLFSFLSSSESFSYHSKIMNEIKYNRIKIDEDFYKKISDKYNIDYEVINNAINLNMASNGQYVIGHIVALDLYNIYKQDKKESFKILNKILSDYKLDTLENVSRYFGYFDNLSKELKEEYNNLDKKFIKKIR